MLLTCLIGNQYQSNDDGESSLTAGKPIHSAIEDLWRDQTRFCDTKLGSDEWERVISLIPNLQVPKNFSKSAR
ncbi:hypothetical protein M8C21_020286 [Ambrosia artemisiifolia]|uniref:Uncharacterized protein n=1 Tax=Ambrosia artemisiifolia TaxID=4212 RepID=A0AAD5GS20_AMBAR|nr:hypothetical protein M8C21_020286 [Ambrosia artemisiifolia]